ncbi:MAG: protein kinase [Firmicutes bacterium]|nr:protein kinase [Bacillota bacterium]
MMERNRRKETLVSVLKVVELIPKEDQDLDRRLEQLMEEIHRMERLDDSPYIVSLKDDLILERPDGGYDVLMRMEYLDCLETMIREESLPWQSPSAKESGTTVVEEVIRMAEDLCRALGSIHGQGMLHRDIKPGNIYRERGGNRWKLGDFGASRTLAFGNDPSTITGTTAYMAPEIARGEEWGPWSDVYSLGIVLYQILNGGFLPLTDETSSYEERENAVLRRWRGEELPVPKGLDDRNLAEIVGKACQRRPEDRYSSAEEMLRDLEALETEERIAVTGKRAPRRRGGVIAAGILSILVAVGSFMGGWSLGSQSVADHSVIGAQDGHRYEVITRKATWESAKVYCESQGGHLATITSKEEEELILSLLDQTDVTIAWLGADNHNSSGGFRWITGEAFEFASWGIGEPNNTNGQEHCLMLSKNENQGWVWNDAPSSGHDFYEMKEIGFVCEWE